MGVIKRDIYSENSIDFIRRLKMWALGFESDRYYLYSLENNDYKDYISDYKNAMTRFINCPYDVILNDKIIFEKNNVSVYQGI